MLQSMGSGRVRHELVTKQQQLLPTTHICMRICYSGSISIEEVNHSLQAWQNKYNNHDSAYKNILNLIIQKGKLYK